MKKNVFFSCMIIVFMCVPFFSTNNAVAWAPPEDLTQPFEYDGYTINMPLILAEDSVLWELLESFDSLYLENEDDYIDCVNTTESFILSHESEMQSTFPWLWDEGDTDDGAHSFCGIIAFIPQYMAEGFENAGILSSDDALTTNIFDTSIVPTWHNIENLIFDHPLVRIEFTEAIDLLSYDFVNMVLGFANAFDADTGFLSFDSSMITGLKNTGAIITFKNIENFEDPVILVDGKIDEDLISALVYDPDEKTVTFNTQHFTSFEVVERSSVSVEDEDKDCKKISGNNAYKTAYQQVKYYKNHDLDLYLALQSVYHTYRIVGDSARNTLMQTDMTTYDKYKQYRRYHKYKECK